MFVDIVATLQGLVDALEDAGVEASLDPADLNLPAVFVTLDRVTDAVLTGGAGTVRARLLLLAPDRDARRSLEALQALYAEVLAVVTPTSDVEATVARTPDGGGEVPALTFTRDLEPLITE